MSPDIISAFLAPLVLLALVAVVFYYGARFVSRQIANLSVRAPGAQSSPRIVACIGGLASGIVSGLASGFLFRQLVMATASLSGNFSVEWLVFLIPMIALLTGAASAHYTGSLVMMKLVPVSVRNAIPSVWMQYRVYVLIGFYLLSGLAGRYFLTG